MAQKDRLLGLKENVIIGKLIPAGTGLPLRRSQLDWLPKAKSLASVLSEEDLAPAAAPPEEEDLSLEDFDEDLEDDDELDVEPESTEKAEAE